MAKASGKVAKKSKDADTISVLMTIEKETKNTFRYKEVTKNEFDRQMLGTLYLPKDVCKGAQNIAVVIALQ